VILRRITTLKELATFTPKLLQLHKGLDGLWEPELNSHEFLANLIDKFDEDAYYFGDFCSDGSLLYFAALIPHRERSAMFWLFYANKDYRNETRPLLFDMKAYIKKTGKYDTVYSQSTRTASSYERWLEKFGAKKLAITYKFNL
jgi:hypothetical protein